MELRNFNNQNSSKKQQIIETKIEDLDAKSFIKELKQEKLKENTSANIHKGHRARLKSQYIASGLESLTDIQKLELLLFFAVPQKDTNPLAHELINHFGSLKEVMRASYKDLQFVKGIKDNSALLIYLVNSFVNYCHKPDEQKDMNTTECCLEYARNLFHGINVEQFYVVCLSKSGKAKKYVLVNSGTTDEVSVRIRKVTEIILENKVNRVMICHNHPYGSAKPSDEDMKLTYSLICSCVLNEIEIIDHIIIGNDSELSFHEADLMEKLRRKAANSVQLTKEQMLFLSSSAKDYKRSKVVNIEF